MNWLIVVLRALHIFGGVFWAGGVFAAARFILPAAEASGAQGTAFMKRLMIDKGFAAALIASGVITILAGLWLLHIDSGGHEGAFMKSGMGLTLGIGALSAIGALATGIASAAAGRRFAKWLGEVEAKGAMTPEQVAEAQGRLARQARRMRAVAVMLAITVLCMAVARYVTF